MAERPVRVLIACPMDEDDLHAIRSVSPRVDVRHHATWYPSSWDKVNPGWATAPPWSSAQWEQWRSELAAAHVLFDLQWVPDLEGLRGGAPGLEWIQATIAGVGGIATRLGPLDGVTLTTAAGVHAVPLAEWAIMSALSLIRRSDRQLRSQVAREWDPRPSEELHGRTALVLGLGHVGSTIARYLRAIGVRVLGVRRSEAPSDAVDQTIRASELSTVLSAVDILILAAPATSETRHLVDGPTLARLPRSAILINVGRGTLVDEDALVTALTAGRLGGAALDVFETEPLPRSSPLWTLPNVIVSPHSAGVSVREDERVRQLFRDNLRRFVDGRALVNVYDPARGY